MYTILIVDDSPMIVDVFATMLERGGYRPITAFSGEECLEVLKKTPPDLVLLDIMMPDMDGYEVCAALKQDTALRDIPVIFVSALNETTDKVRALDVGGVDYITKPFELDEIKNVVAKAVKTGNLKKNEFLMTPEDIERAGIIGDSRAMQEMFDAIKRVAPTTTTVLITGETGTGKELVAEAIHRNSPRKNNPLIKINCAAIAESLMESELFGHEKGSFTGAAITKPGKFELAHKGTMFLDEVAEIPREMQVKLLRVLQEQEFERIGGLKTIKVDVRFIAATNRNLTQSVAEGSFREDLFYRLNVFPINVPPLRERTEDISVLADYFIQKFNQKLVDKYNRIRENEVRFEEFQCSDADYLLVAYGTSARICQKSVQLARAEGLKVGLLRPITLFPFPSKRISEIAEKVSLMVSVEMSAGQMVEDVLLSVNGKVPVHHYGRMGGIVPTPDEVVAFLKSKIIGG